MRLIEWEVGEDEYEEQINIPKEQRDLAKAEGISTEVGQKVAVTILNLNTGESYTAGWPLQGVNKSICQLKYKKCSKVPGKSAFRFWAVEAVNNRT